MSAFLALALLMYLAWKLFQEYVTGSPLDQIPGPRASSWLAGNVPPPLFSTLVPITSLSGNIPQFYDKTGKYYYKFLQQCEQGCSDSWSYQTLTKIGADGSVMKLNGLLGVGFSFAQVTRDSDLMAST